MLKAMSFASIGVVNSLVDLGLFLLVFKYLTGVAGGRQYHVLVRRGQRLLR